MVKLTRVSLLDGYRDRRSYSGVEVDPADVDDLEVAFHSDGDPFTWVCSKRGRGYDISVNETVKRVRELIGGEATE